MGDIDQCEGGVVLAIAPLRRFYNPFAGGNGGLWSPEFEEGELAQLGLGSLGGWRRGGCRCRGVCDRPLGTWGGGVME